MIGFLRGTLLSKQPPGLLIDVHGVGYEVDAPMSTFYDLPEPGCEVTLFTHLVVRDDAHILFGFASEGERGLFRSLIKVNGVGAKLALAILSGISADDFALCVINEDSRALVRVPGIGKKTAERLIIEMRDRLPQPAAGASGVSAPVSAGDRVADDPVREAVSALIALGYSPSDASRMVRKLDTSALASDEIIRQALQGAAG